MYAKAIRKKEARNGYLPALMLAILGIVACAAPTRTPSRPPAQPVEPSGPQTRLPTIQYTIQVGAFSTTERAARYAVRLESDGLDAYYFIDTDGLYKVRFGRFDTKAAAVRYASANRTKGLIDDYYIVRPGAAGRQAGLPAAIRENLVRTARRFIGTPYRWGGASARSGFDCSGLTMTVYRLNGMELPRNSRSQFRAGISIPRRSLQKGDLVFFATDGGNRVSHVGIYSGQGRFIHAPGRGKRIRVASLSNSYFRARYKGARRYF